MEYQFTVNLFIFVEYQFSWFFCPVCTTKSSNLTQLERNIQQVSKWYAKKLTNTSCYGNSYKIDTNKNKWKQSSTGQYFLIKTTEKLYSTYYSILQNKTSDSTLINIICCQIKKNQFLVSNGTKKYMRDRTDILKRYCCLPWC